MATLEGMAISLNQPANARSTQANIANMSSTQQVRLQQCQQAVAAQQAKIQMLQMAAQQDADQREYLHRTQQIQTTNNFSLGNTSAVYQYVDL
jgi:hypothetical protein